MATFAIDTYSDHQIEFANFRKNARKYNELPKINTFDTIATYVVETFSDCSIQTLLCADIAPKSSNSTKTNCCGYYQLYR